MSFGRSAAATLLVAAMSLPGLAAAQQTNPPDPPGAAAAEDSAGSADAPAPASDRADQGDESAEGGGDSGGESSADTPYTVQCGGEGVGAQGCQVDRDTYVGWRTFHSVCHTCHAQDAVGSSFAPPLLPIIRQMEKERFVEVVDKGFTGQIGVMPAWGNNPNVNRFYDELWAYLRARADGVLPPGRPNRLPD